MAMFLSSLFVPVNKNGPAKVKDPGLVNIVKAGYALYDNHRDALLLLPLGIRLRESLAEELEDTFSARGVQSICTGNPEEGALMVASRTLKTQNQLPLLFMERSENAFYLSAVLSDQDSMVAWMEDFLVRLYKTLDYVEVYSAFVGEASYEEGIWEEHWSFYVPAELHAWKGEEGFICTECAWGGHADSLLSEDFSEDEEEKQEDLQPLREVHTPGADTIEELCRQLDLPPEKTLKTMFFSTEGEETSRVVVALMRGDRKISPLKLAKCLNAPSVRLATPEELHKAMGILGGYLGPQGVPENVMMVADGSVEGLVNVAVGANKPDYHCTGACWGRDFSTPHVTDLLQLEEGSPCPRCKNPLQKQTWRKVASFGTAPGLRARYSSLDYRDEEHQKREPQFLSGRVDLEQILLSLFEGESPLPLLLAPFVAYLYVGEDAQDSEEAGDLLEEVRERLEEADIPTLTDDCTEKPKNREFNAMVLRFPWVLQITREGVAQGKVLLSSAEDENLLLAPEDLDSYFESFFEEALGMPEEEEGEDVLF